MPRFESWQSCEFAIIAQSGAPTLLTLIKNLSYADEAQTEIVHAAGAEPVGTTDPVNVPGEISFEVYTRPWLDYIKTVTDNGATRLSAIDFRMTHKIQARGQTTARVITIDFQITGMESGTQEAGSAAPLVIPVKGQIVAPIDRDGVKL